MTTSTIITCSEPGCERTADMAAPHAADGWQIAPTPRCYVHVGVDPDDCPACFGSGKIDPNSTLGGRSAGGGVCPVCRGKGKVIARPTNHPGLFVHITER